MICDDLTKGGDMLETASRTDQSPNALDGAMGLNIRARRKALRMSQTTLATAVGVTFQQIQKYERGGNRVSFSRLVDIAHALDCRVANLIGEMDEWVPRPVFRRDTAHLREDTGGRLIAAYALLPVGLRKAVLNLVREIAKAT
jgi:transcriptional regulator with XRE-family HTH domain